ncbi:hypothetical protein M2447_001797 [Ereboglobus sp. PH5-10]|uniref:hypothetical protein n=1 Tax=Ereboglobus sp. PH5-10 TaxID=2940629 RepID=UPI0024055C4C|nr:hypothetical protein [Ereboglobus sp. PH5-10]MDF9827698.1 hypothetical protein [Ereboglobus sp. PH5-10]
MQIQTHPITLSIEIESFRPPPKKNKGVPAYAISARLIEKRKDGISKVLLVVSDITSESIPFLAIGSRWRINVDEGIFHQRKDEGLCFGTLSELQPIPLEKRAEPVVRANADER